MQRSTKKTSLRYSPYPSSSTSQQATFPTTSATPLSQYRRFLNRFVVNKAPANFSQADVDAWHDSDVLPGDQGKIVDEIAEKFNTHNKLGINEVNESNSPTSMASYWGHPVSLALRSNPNPMTVGHELVHANDHQHDNLNEKVWRHLQRLHTAVGNNSTAFSKSIASIRDKIDPTKAFSRSYNDDFQRGKIVKDINYWRDRKELPPFVPPPWSNKKSTDNWGSTFQEIPQVVTDIDSNTGVQNRPFFLGGPSEFPAFMSERLTVPWGTNVEPAPLSVPEAQFLYNTLESMDEDYPKAEYPVMHTHNKARRKSLDKAYPNALVSQMHQQQGASNPLMQMMTHEKKETI